MKREVYKYVERELFDLDQTIKNIRELEHNLITTSESNDINGSIRAGVSKTTENKAMKLINNKVLNRMHNTVSNINTATRKLDEELFKLYVLRYRKQIHHVKIIMDHLPMSERTYRRKRNEIIKAVASEMGLI